MMLLVDYLISLAVAVVLVLLGWWLRGEHDRVKGRGGRDILGTYLCKIARKRKPDRDQPPIGTIYGPSGTDRPGPKAKMKRRR